MLGTPPALIAWIVPRAIASLVGTRVQIPVAAEPGGHAALTKPGELAGFRASAPPESTWRNEVTPGIFLVVASFRPVTKARRISQPLWVGLGERDVTTHNAAVTKLAARAPQGELHSYDADHFEVLARPLAERIALDQVDFLRSIGVAG